MQIYSFSPFGYEGNLVTVEVDLRRGIPCIDIVGLADGAVKESRERMQAAIRNSGLDFPLERVLISLSPADLRKEGAGFDLPIALGVLSAKSDAEENQTEKSFSEPVMVMGELELSGKIRAVKGIHAAASTAMSAGITKCIVPSANAEEAREVTGMKVFGAGTLEEAFSALSSEENFTERVKAGKLSSENAPEGSVEIECVLFGPVFPGTDFSDIQGQKKLIRALQIAAAGGHNLIAIGEPGCGKTMAIQKFPSLLPLLTVEEAQSVTRIHSLSGLLKPDQSLIRIPPFRMPHQTASIEGICGGGPNCRPGEISLSHNGVLFLDEAAEFRSSVLQMLRVPLETSRITLARAGRSTVYPADFQLLMAANPCPCGNYGSKTKICLCSSRSVEMYWKKFSAPLLDRIDLRVHVESDAEDKGEPVSSLELRKEIGKAVFIQRQRQGIKNAALSPEQISKFCRINDEGNLLIEKARERYGFSPRAVSSILKLSRTISDMKGEKEITPPSVEEAVEFRKNFSSFMEME